MLLEEPSFFFDMVIVSERINFELLFDEDCIDNLVLYGAGDGDYSFSTFFFLKDENTIYL